MRNLTRSVMIGLGALVACTAAYALNVDQNRTPPVRLNTTQQVGYYRLTVNYNDPNISTAQRFGTLPSGSFITGVFCEVVTAFNAASTNVFTLGTTSTANELVAAGDVTEGTTGIYVASRGLGRSLTASGDTALYAKYTQTGTAATAGVATCVITYIPNNDM